MFQTPKRANRFDGCLDRSSFAKGMRPNDHRVVGPDLARDLVSCIRARGVCRGVLCDHVDDWIRLKRGGDIGFGSLLTWGMR